MDYFDYARRNGNGPSQDRLNAPLPVPPPNLNTPSGDSYGSRPLAQTNSRQNLRTPSSIGIRRLGSSNLIPPAQAQQNAEEMANRRRSSSAPLRHQQAPSTGSDLARTSTADPYMETLSEEPGQRSRGLSPGAWLHPSGMEAAQTPSINLEGDPGSDRFAGGAGAMHSAGNAARSNRGLKRFRSHIGLQEKAQQQSSAESGEYEDDVVDLLDLVGMLGRCCARDGLGIFY